jgi:hypothetical protein
MPVWLRQWNLLNHSFASILRRSLLFTAAYSAPRSYSSPSRKIIQEEAAWRPLNASKPPIDVWWCQSAVLYFFSSK